MNVRRYHDVADQEKLAATSLIRKHTQNQVPLSGRKLGAALGKICRHKEKPVARLNPPQVCHDSCMIIRCRVQVDIDVAL